MMKTTSCLMAFAAVWMTGCMGGNGVDDSARPGGGPSTDNAAATATTRSDGATRIPLSISGSLQNPCFSPDGTRLVLTQWTGGYNEGSAYLYTATLSTGAATKLTTASGVNVNMPGSCWNQYTKSITYSSTHTTEGEDEIFTIPEGGGAAKQVTSIANHVSYEPVFSPDGPWIAFETHDTTAGEDAPGRIMKVRADGTQLTELTHGEGDDRQPNWSPAGDKILFQRTQSDGSHDVYTMNTDGTSVKNVTNSTADETDAAFSPDGTYILFSSDNSELALASLHVIPVNGGTPVRVTKANSYYDGAPSWSADGQWITFESRAGAPDGSSGTQIWKIAAPKL